MTAACRPLTGMTTPCTVTASRSEPSKAWVTSTPDASTSSFESSTAPSETFSGFGSGSDGSSVTARFGDWQEEWITRALDRHRASRKRQTHRPWLLRSPARSIPPSLYVKQAIRILKRVLNLVHLDGGAMGRCTVNSEPTPGWLSHSTLPRCAWTIACAMERPNPPLCASAALGGATRKNRSKICGM